MSGHRNWHEIRVQSARERQEPFRTLRELRRESEVSQQDMADELGVSQARISKIEHQDDPQISTLMRYLGALGANLELRVVFPDRAAQLYFLAGEVADDEDPAKDSAVATHASRIDPVAFSL